MGPSRTEWEKVNPARNAQVVGSSPTSGSRSEIILTSRLSPSRGERWVQPRIRVGDDQIRVPFGEPAAEVGDNVAYASLERRTARTTWL